MDSVRRLRLPKCSNLRGLTRCTALFKKLWIRVRPSNLLPQACLRGIKLKRDNGGHMVIKTSLFSRSTAFRYVLKVHIFYPQELQAINMDPYRFIWQNIRDQQPDTDALPEISLALHTRKRIRRAAKAAIAERSWRGEGGEVALRMQQDTGCSFLLEETDKLCMSGDLAGPSRAEEFILVEMERALMRTYDATEDERLFDALQRLLAYHQARGYLGTLAVADRAGNEVFTQQLKELKRHVRKRVMICHTPKAPNYLLMDLFEALIAGVAMAWAILSLYIAWIVMGGPRSAGITLNFAAPVICVTVIAYMLKDRIKIWGKRYFGNIADWVGIFRPEYDSWLCTDEGTKVGTCGAISVVKRPEALSQRIRAVRNAQTEGPAELVMCYTKRCRLDLSRVKPGLPDCAILDVMTIDMSFLSSKMQPSDDHHWLLDTSSGRVSKVPCPRVYRADIVIEYGTGEDSLLQRYQAVLNRESLLRVEPGAEMHHSSSYVR